LPTVRPDDLLRMLVRTQDACVLVDVGNHGIGQLLRETEVEKRLIPSEVTACAQDRDLDACETDVLRHRFVGRETQVKASKTVLICRHDDAIVESSSHAK